MLGNRKLGWMLVVIGVLANNYVYLHDIVTNGHGGAILLGWHAGVAIGMSLAVIALGLAMAWRGGSRKTSL
jgi:hypothetical protein